MAYLIDIFYKLMNIDKKHAGMIKVVLIFLILIVFLGVIFFLTPFKQVA